MSFVVKVLQCFFTLSSGIDVFVGKGKQEFFFFLLFWVYPPSDSPVVFLFDRGIFCAVQFLRAQFSSLTFCSVQHTFFFFFSFIIFSCVPHFFSYLVQGRVHFLQKFSTSGFTQGPTFLSWRRVHFSVSWVGSSFGHVPPRTLHPSLLFSKVQRYFFLFSSSSYPVFLRVPPFSSPSFIQFTHSGKFRLGTFPTTSGPFVRTGVHQGRHCYNFLNFPSFTVLPFFTFFSKLFPFFFTS